MVNSAKPLDNMMMILIFSTGEQRLFDATILTGSAFQPFTDEAMTVKSLMVSLPGWMKK